MSLEDIDFRQKAQQLLDEWNLVRSARPRSDTVHILNERDSIEKWAEHLRKIMLWSDQENEVAEASYQFEYRMYQYKDKVVIEILTNGTI